MKYLLTKDELEEMVLCIVQCELDEYEAMHYLDEFIEDNMIVECKKDL